MTEWFRRKSDKIKTFDKKDTEHGQWQKCPSCSEVLYYKSLQDNNFICTICTYHFRISSKDYFKLLFDNDDNMEIGKEIKIQDRVAKGVGKAKVAAVRSDRPSELCKRAETMPDRDHGGAPSLSKRSVI